MRNIDATTITPAFLQRLNDCADPRLKQVLSALVTHLHDFAREVKLTEAEWMQGIQFLTATRPDVRRTRQEFILLSDTLGLSMLVVAMNQRQAARRHRGHGVRPLPRRRRAGRRAGRRHRRRRAGHAAVRERRVLDLQGRPIAGAEVDVWQADDDGLYDVQRPELRPHAPRAWRAAQRCGRAGALSQHHAHAPTPCPPTARSGQMLLASGRHPWRPAHLHFMIRAAGFETLITHIFRDPDPYLDSDVVFGVRSSLIGDFVPHDAGTAPDGSTVRHALLHAGPGLRAGATNMTRCTSPSGPPMRQACGPPASACARRTARGCAPRRSRGASPARRPHARRRRRAHERHAAGAPGRAHRRRAQVRRRRPVRPRRRVPIRRSAALGLGPGHPRESP